jgi:hypothetical protein
MKEVAMFLRDSILEPAKMAFCLLEFVVNYDMSSRVCVS